jgi:hypothetical protein
MANFAQAGESQAALPILPQSTSATRGTDLIFALLRGNTATGVDDASTIGKPSDNTTAEAHQREDAWAEIFGIPDLLHAKRLLTNDRQLLRRSTGRIRA